jgi:hypothetical protein
LWGFFGNSDAPHQLSGVNRSVCGLELVGKQRRRIVSDQASVPDHIDDNGHGACNADCAIRE